jgi:hypothetical protein
MKRYRNLDGNSGVRAYSIQPDSITIQFADGARYLYTYASAGKSNIEEMKMLAESGKGLSTFISQHVHDAYRAKLD